MCNEEEMSPKHQTPDAGTIRMQRDKPLSCPLCMKPISSTCAGKFLVDYIFFICPGRQIFQFRRYAKKHRRNGYIVFNGWGHAAWYYVRECLHTQALMLSPRACLAKLRQNNGIPCVMRTSSGTYHAVSVYMPKLGSCLSEDVRLKSRETFMYLAIMFWV